MNRGQSTGLWPFLVFADCAHPADGRSDLAWSFRDSDRRIRKPFLGTLKLVMLRVLGGEIFAPREDSERCRHRGGLVQAGLPGHSGFRF